MPLNLQSLNYDQVIHRPEQIPELLRQCQTQLQKLPNDCSSNALLQTALNLKMIQTTSALRYFPMQILIMADQFSQQSHANQTMPTLYYQDQFNQAFQQALKQIYPKLLIHDPTFEQAVQKILYQYGDLVILPPNLHKFFNDHRFDLLTLANAHPQAIRQFNRQLKHRLDQKEDNLKPGQFALDRTGDDLGMTFLSNFSWLKALAHHLRVVNWHGFQTRTLTSIEPVIAQYVNPSQTRLNHDLSAHVEPN